MIKNKLGFVFFIIALGFLFSPSLTGNVIGESYYFNAFFLIGFIFLILSFILFVSRQRLDAILIPIGPSYEADIEKAKTAAKRYDKGKGANYLIISGDLGEKDLSVSQRANIYRTLREYGTRSRDIKIEGKSKNSLENLLYSLKKIKKKGVKKVGIVSNPSHLNRFYDIFNAAKKQGVITRDFKMYRIRTKESFTDSIYGIFSRLFYRYKLSGGVRKAKEVKTPKWMKNIAGFFYKILGR